MLYFGNDDAIHVLNVRSDVITMTIIGIDIESNVSVVASLNLAMV